MSQSAAVCPAWQETEAPASGDSHDAPLAPGTPAGTVSEATRERLYQFVLPLLIQLDRHIDVRLVRTLWQAIEAMIQFRHRAHGLLLSELGAFLLSPDKAPAGTKRLSNLLRCPKWSAELIERFLWQQARERHQALVEAGQTALLLWDASVLEKPESQRAEGLCAVRSAKAARLKRIKPGFYTPPPGPAVFVPGLHWIALLLIGLSGPPTVAAMRWFSTRGKGTTDARAVQYALLQQCARSFGGAALHLFDRGYAGTPWLAALQQGRLRFVLRWPKHYKLLSQEGTVKAAWQIARGQRSWDTRLLWDAKKRCLAPVGVLAMGVQHPEEPGPLSLVVARRGRGQEPWYLLTSEPITNVEEAWQIVLSYARRYQIEMAFRFGKSELAMESPRLWTWERRVKLLLLVTLAYAFLLSLLDEPLLWLREWLLRNYCHRTGKRSREVAAPLYRLRAALSRLWQDHPQPAAPRLALSSG
ncbi:MAG TPA: transposase [Gemmatimonadales bacterium]|nr:transposase [Gemmatimonadales bacterium]